MAYSDTIDQIAERVDHLLLRHEELQRTNALLTQQVQALSLERDQLKSRLAAARARVDALIERLPTSATPAAPATVSRRVFSQTKTQLSSQTTGRPETGGWEGDEGRSVSPDTGQQGDLSQDRL